MEDKSFFRIVGWGFLPMPGERLRWRQAQEKANLLVSYAERFGDPDSSSPSRVDADLDDRIAPSEQSRRSSPSLSAERYEFMIPGAGGRCTIGVIPGDILKVHDVAIWVNAENTDMDMARETENSISGIIRYWGGRPGRTNRLNKSDPQSDVIAHLLAKAVGAAGPVAPGSAFRTDSGRLRASHGVRYIIHVAAVQGEPGAGYQRVRNIGLCVTSALALANDTATKDPAATSILFPLLGTGMGGAELTPTVRTLVQAARRFVEAGTAPALRKIYFLAYTDAELGTLLDVLENEERLEWADAEETTSDSG